MACTARLAEASDVDRSILNQKVQAKHATLSGVWVTSPAKYLQFAASQGLNHQKLTQPTVLRSLASPSLALGMWLWETLFKKRPPKRTSGRPSAPFYSPYIWSRPPAGYPPPPPWYGPGRSTGPGTWHAFTAPSLGYVPSMFAFVPALSRVPCKYHRILHHLQRLRLHQPAFPPIHNHPTHSHRGRGREP